MRYFCIWRKFINFSNLIADRAVEHEVVADPPDVGLVEGRVEDFAAPHPLQVVQHHPRVEPLQLDLLVFRWSIFKINRNILFL